ncbi:MAG: hypothetical protein AB1831_01770 [Pseudomonadota bacterium]
MRTLQAHEAKARFATYLAKLKASKVAEAAYDKDMEQVVATSIRYRRAAGQEQRV